MTELDHIIEYLADFNLKLDNVEWNKPRSSQGSFFMVYLNLEKSIQTNPLSFYSDTLILKALTEGANPNTINNQGKSALHLASSSYSVAHLINFGANIHIQDREGKTPFYYLMDDALHGVHFDDHLEKMKILLLHGATIEEEHLQALETYRYKDKLTEIFELVKIEKEKNALDATMSENSQSKHKIKL